MISSIRYCSISIDTRSDSRCRAAKTRCWCPERAGSPTTSIFRTKPIARLCAAIMRTGSIRGIDTAAARGMPGVLGIYTAADLERGGVGPLPPRQVMNNRDGTPMLSPVRYALATDKVRYVGDPIAAIVAETAAQAKDAAEAVIVDIDPVAGRHVSPGGGRHPERRFSMTMFPGMSGSIFIMATARRSPPLLPPPRMSRGSSCATTASSSMRWSRAPRSRSTSPSDSTGPSMCRARGCSGSAITSPACSGSGATNCA